MSNDWASENLQTIRTLMERSALYRRALAPILSVTGLIGLIASALAYFAKIETDRSFVTFWIATGVAAFLAALLLVRRQALQDSEPFWSPPTRRVWTALLPNFLAGVAVGSLFVVQMAWILPALWMLFYGCGLCAAGFFMQRSIKLFGWIFVFCGLVSLLSAVFFSQLRTLVTANGAMGLFFGAFHLAFGIYLFFTERKKNEA